MSMTLEEAFSILQEKYDYCKSFYDLAANPEKDYKEMAKYLQALQAVLVALRRERVEKVWKGEWVERVTGMDDMGEQHEVTIDERCEYDDLYCSKCGKQSPDNFLNFCGYCGAPMTDEAVEMVMERLEALKDGKGD